MNDVNECSEARHEAAEGLANYFNVKDRTIQHMQKYWDDKDDLLRQTVRVAIPKL